MAITRLSSCDPVRAFKRLPGVQLVPAGNGRALISLDHPQSVPQLELAARDLSDRRELTASERQAMGQLADILRQARQSRRMTLEERTIIVLQSKRRRRQT